MPRSSPFVLPEDAGFIECFNQKAKPAHKIRVELLPEPYLGDPLAPVVLLSLNPGFSDADLGIHQNPVFAARSMDNLFHHPNKYPFFLLNPELNTAPGNGWWNRKLSELIEEAGLETVASRLLCVEFFPYHSRQYRKCKNTLPSQLYSFDLVRKAMRRGAVIIMMRSSRLWLEAIPELNKYKVHCVNSVQNPKISAKNCPDGYRCASTAIFNA